MCGITGIVGITSQQDICDTNLQIMNATLNHRGPDQGDTWFHEGVGLGHRRLSIIDLSDAGRQPMHSADGRAVIVFNGEIYNFLALKKTLTAKGYSFKSGTDTEVILNAWLEWGTSCVNHLRGMFAFAIYDQTTKEIFIARDRLGIKPLYYALIDDQFYFASELKALEAVLRSQLNTDYQAVVDFFSLGYIPDPKSIYQEIRKLEPASFIHVKQQTGEWQKERYWRMSFSTKLDNDIKAKSEEAWLEAFTEQFNDAVSSHLVADVPLGAFLSGGVDSSAVVATMSAVGVDYINTCSIGFDEERYDETIYARQVAERYQTIHHEKIVKPDDFSLIEQLTDVFDEPYADSSAMPTYRVCQSAREHVKVCLSGDGGDELLAGYRRHRLHMGEEKFRGTLPESFRRHVFKPLGHFYPKMDWAPQMFRAKTTFQGLAYDSVEAYFQSVSQLNYDQLSGLFSEDFKASMGDYSTLSVYRDAARHFDGDDGLSLIQHLDFSVWLPGDILVKTDRTSMAHSLEVRVPFLDHVFVEWASKIPPHFRLAQGHGKYILKRAMEPKLSEDILYRKKMGFDVPISEWFRSSLYNILKERLLNGRLKDLGVFNMTHIKRLIEEHRQGIRENKRALWALLMFSQYLEKNS